MTALSGKGIGASFIDRADKYLGEIERKANAELAQAQSAALPTKERLEAAKAYESQVRLALDQATRSFMALEAKATPSPKSFLAKIMGGQSTAETPQQREAAIAQLRDRMIQAQQAMGVAETIVARAERALAADMAAREAKIVEAQRAAGETLGYVRASRSLMVLYPALAYSGPSFAHWAGRQVFKSRRKNALRDPNAKTIWGIPLEFGQQQ